MTRTAALLNGLVAAAALVAAFASWQFPRSYLADASVRLVAATPATLTGIRLDDGQRSLALRKRPGTPPRWWVTDAELDPARKVPGATKSIKEVPAGPQADEVIKRFAPLDAVRGLGQLSAEQLAELDLQNPKYRLEVSTGGEAHLFRAAPPLPGLIGGYVMDGRNDVYLVDGSLLSWFKGASLVDSRLHLFKPDQVRGWTLEVNGKTAAFVSAKDGRGFARAGGPGDADANATSWYTRFISSLVASEVLGLGESPNREAPTVSMKVTYALGDGREAWLYLATTGKSEVWAKTESTASWVKVQPSAKQALDDAASLIR